MCAGGEGGESHASHTGGLKRRRRNTMAPLRFAMVCASNMNRSMEAHAALAAEGMQVRERGGGRGTQEERRRWPIPLASLKPHAPPTLCYPPIKGHLLRHRQGRQTARPHRGRPQHIPLWHTVCGHRGEREREGEEKESPQAGLNLLTPPARSPCCSSSFSLCPPFSHTVRPHRPGPGPVRPHRPHRNGRPERGRQARPAKVAG